MKVKITAGATLAKVFVFGTNNQVLDGVYFALLGSNPNCIPTQFFDTGETPVEIPTTNFVYESKPAIHEINDIQIDVTQSIKDNAGQEYVKVVI